ncbi:MAG: N-6 DNA methylase [Chloroflexota bacterium]|nr:N-6 DNA methylase [Chloroflexota bacterium]
MRRLSDVQLDEIARELAARPGHETVRSDVRQLLIDGLEIPREDVRLEAHIREVRGRIDALLGRTVIEFKSDLRRESADATEQLTRYIAQRQDESGERYVGIATDGADFVSYELRDEDLRELGTYKTDTANPNGLLSWLGPAVAAGDDLDPDPEAVVRELGRQSPAWNRALGDLRDAWKEVGAQPEPLLKRQLWAQRLELVYGAPVDRDDIFFQHTYLSVVAKTIAMHVLGLPTPQPADLLSGRPFEQAGVTGVVESDFFDWILAASNGADLVDRIARHVGRFRLGEVQADVLKGLYESLIDPENRHDLGEYYTPDWLAARLCAEAVDRPLEQRTLDPSCGSGAFLFHALRRLLDAAEAEGLNTPAALRCCLDKVIGIDVHPVAVQIARVTYLLALGERLRDPNRPNLAIPVYLGDAMQWNVQDFLADREVLIEVPDGPVLHFPYAVTRVPADFDAVIELMLRLSESGSEKPNFLAALRRRLPCIDESSRTILGQTYADLHDLRVQGRDHIWGFVARNLVRPVWLSSDDQRADVVIGNPPWLSYRYMSEQNQRRFREESQRLGIWAGGRVATHQDLSAYFFARCCELYLKRNANIAFVMPYAALSRRQFAGFRSGSFLVRQSLENSVMARFTQAWAFDDDVQPLFPVPSCVLFADGGEVGDLPSNVLRASGQLPHRDATPDEAERWLKWHVAPWPTTGDDDASASPYQKSFHQGATLVPRFLCLVEPAAAGPLGSAAQAPLVTSRRSRQENAPWRDLDSLTGNVERQFLRPVYLGESVSPFRLLTAPLGVIPWDPDFGLLDAASAGLAGYSDLAAWMLKAEELWDTHRSSDRLSFSGRVDYHRGLVSQFPSPPLRVVYAASGSKPAAAILEDRDAVVEHALYWAAIETPDEARYLTTVINSEVLRATVEDRQARGQWGARHFDRLLASAIPPFDPACPLHTALAKAGHHAQTIADQVPLKDGVHFTTARRQIRTALAEDGVAGEVDSLVAELLRSVTR